MEEKDFDELLFEEKKNPKNLKNIILGAIIVVAILIIALLVWSFSKDSNQSASDASNTQTEQIQDDTYGDSIQHDHDDRFEQIMKDVRNSIDKDGAEIGNNQDIQPLNQDSQIPDPQLQNMHMGNNDEKHNLEDTQMEAPSMETPEFHPAMRPNENEIPTPDEVMKAKKPAPKKPVHHPKPVHKPAPKLKLDAQGEVAKPGSYLQIGVFSKTPGQELQKILKKHSYRTQEVWVNEQKLTKYLVGPFKNRSEASRYKTAHPDLKFSVYYEVK